MRNIQLDIRRNRMELWHQFEYLTTYFTYCICFTYINHTGIIISTSRTCHLKSLSIDFPAGVNHNANSPNAPSTSPFTAEVTILRISLTDAALQSARDTGI